MPWVLQQRLLAQLTQQSTWSHSKSSVVEVSNAAQAPLVQACCPLHTSTWVSMLLHTWQPVVTPLEAATSTPSIKSARATIIRLLMIVALRCRNTSTGVPASNSKDAFVTADTFIGTLYDVSAMLLLYAMTVHSLEVFHPFLDIPMMWMLHMHAVIP